MAKKKNRNKKYFSDGPTPDKWYTNKDFQKLQYKWYQKLKAAGFHDVETIDWTTGDSMHILNTKTFKSSAEVVRAYSSDKQRYYELARQHYWDLQEENERASSKKPHSRRVLGVWRRYADGMTKAAIQRETGWPMSQINNIVSQHEKLMLEPKDTAEVIPFPVTR